LFSSLFPEIPPLDEEVVAQKGVEGVLDYYQKVVHVWLQKEKAKMDFLLASPRK
jgi:selenocysteine lyase/cysteine desulfurase